jgi:hypothetical protein
MVRNSTFCVGCGLVAAIPAVPFVLLVVASILARYIPIDDPLFQRKPLENWLAQVESDIPAERDEAARILADIFARSAFDEPMNCHPLGGLDPSFQRDVLVARHHNRFISLHALPISAALERIACREDPPNNPDAMRGLSCVGRWAGEDEQRRVLPLLIADCNDRNTETRKLAIGNVMTALRYSNGYESYGMLPIEDFRPLILEALDDEQHRRDAVNILGMMGTRAGPEVLDDLLRVKEEESGETYGTRSQIDWAIGRVRGEQ